MRDSVAHLIRCCDHGTTLVVDLSPAVSHITFLAVCRATNSDLDEGVFGSTFRSTQQSCRLCSPTCSPMTLRQASPARVVRVLLSVLAQRTLPCCKVVQLARQRGLLILTAGSDTIRILPSLTVTREQVDKAVDIIESCLLVVRDEVSRSTRPRPRRDLQKQTQQQARAYSTSASGSVENASASEIQSLYKDFISLAQSWPKDPLRPEIDFGASITAAAQSALLTIQSHQHSTPPSRCQGPGNPLPNPLPGTKTLTTAELEYAKRASPSCKNSRTTRYSWNIHCQKAYSSQRVSQSTTEVDQDIDRAVKGKSVGPSWGERVRMFFGKN